MKEIIRKKYLNIRKQIENKYEKSITICNKIINTKEYQESKYICVYKSLKDEVNTDEIIKHAISKNKIVVLPRVENDDLMLYKITSYDEKLKKSKLGVEEPLGNFKNLVDKKEIDLVIVPAVCFDKERNRIGFGKGFYDRFLKNANLNTLGICFEEQVVKEYLLPVRDNDIKINKVITDKNVY